MRFLKRALIVLSLTLACAIGVSAQTHGRRRAARPNPARGLSPAAQREAEWLKGRPDGDKDIIRKAAEDFS